MINPWLRVFTPFAVGYFFSYLLRNVNAVIAPELTNELALSPADLGLLTSAYLFGFGAFQLPLGVLLDRYGPRKVEAALLLIAAAGTLTFGLSGNLAGLVAGRAMIGLGVSACLMGSFKAFSLWFPAERQASLNAAVMAAGGLGALAATTPVGWALPVLGWRGVFIAVAMLVFMVAGLIFATPERPTGTHHEKLRDQLNALGGILKHRVFWRFAPQAIAVIGGFMALTGLWAVPWLMEVEGYTRDQAAFHLLLTSVAMLIGFLSIAAFVVRLKHMGIDPETILKVGLGVGIVTLLAVRLGIGSSHLQWFVLGLVFSVSNLAYALLAGHFPRELSGRVNTALNLGTFIGAFGIQWGIGALVDLFIAQGMSTPDAYRRAFGALIAFQAAAYGWFVLGGRQVASRDG
ncbi:MAG: MFS transporter [Gammaproteobacteria bacterium]|nr:MFS transporter [Gammaproteobacteria bacterium]MBU1416084.1 MFS transporter [Gammaproteobacteria bacterium]